MTDITPGEKPYPNKPGRDELDKERYELMQHLEDWLETPMVFLAFVWLSLLVVELVWGERYPFRIIGTLIWIIFILHFALEFSLAPHKTAYLKRNWLTAISLVIPALRIFRIYRLFQLFRMARVGRGLSLVRLISSLNRGMRALGASLQRRGFGYVILLSILVIITGAAGMFAFENRIPGGLNSYGEALWWTSMIMTTMGSQYWPQTFEGRVLCFFLALYAFGIFGYVTATLASFFIGRDAESSDAEIAGASELATLRKELIALRDEIKSYRTKDLQE
jgi:voltage-gated potassium channel